MVPAATLQSRGELTEETPIKDGEMQRQNLITFQSPTLPNLIMLCFHPLFSEPRLSILVSVSLSSLESFILKRGEPFLFSFYPGLGTFLDEITSFILWGIHSSREGTSKASSVRYIRWSLCWSTGKINKIKQACFLQVWGGVTKFKGVLGS